MFGERRDFCDKVWAEVRGNAAFACAILKQTPDRNAGCAAECVHPCCSGDHNSKLNEQDVV
eukprot:4399242-Prymnesium_polylepis.1